MLKLTQQNMLKATLFQRWGYTPGSLDEDLREGCSDGHAKAVLLNDYI